MRRRDFEDFTEGEEIDLGTRLVTREEIIAFASEYDAQPMHLDEEAARHTMLGGLAGSGWHTAAMLMRLLYDGILAGSSSMGSPGIDELKWMRPVRPGDQLAAKAVIVSTRISKSRPELGFVAMRFEMANQAGETVLMMDCPIMFARREAGAPAEAAR